VATLPRGMKLLQAVGRRGGEGCTNRDMSRGSNPSEHTVRNYLFRIFNKVGASNRLELALYVINQREGNGNHLVGTGEREIASV
jgi:two-component system, NarL family, nitrate/nitrite response regulator NarL